MIGYSLRFGSDSIVRSEYEIFFQIRGSASRGTSSFCHDLDRFNDLPFPQIV